MKKTTALCLCLLMLVLLAASQAGSAAQEAPAAPPTEITIMIYDRGTIKNERPIYDSMFTDYFNERMQALYNVSLKFVPVPRSEDVSTLNVMLASREAPDMMYTYTESAFYSWAQMGALAPLEEALETHGPNVTAFLDARTGLREMGIYKDTLYAIRGSSADVYRGSQTYIRGDWLDKLGLDLPTTPEEMLGVLRAFKENAQALGMDSVVPLAMAMGGAISSSRNHDSIISGFGLSTDHELVDGKVYPMVANPNYKEYLFFLNTCYREGLIYSEFVTDTDGAKALEQKERQQIGVWTSNLSQIASENSLNATEAAMANGTEFIYLDALLDSQGQQHKIVDSHPGYCIMVPEYSKHVNEVMMYLDWSAVEGFPVQYYGFEGVHFDWNEKGQPVFHQEARERDGYNFGDQTPIRPVLKDADYFNAVMPSARLAEIATYAYEMIPVNARPPLMTIYETLPAQDMYSVILSDIATQGFVNVVTSQDPQAAYDAFIAEYMASGGQQLMDELTAYYQSQQ